MNTGARLIILGSILTSIFVCVMTSIINPELAQANVIRTDAAQIVASNNNDNIICSLNPNYPQNILKWCHLITQFASENHVDPNLVAAIIFQESGGNPEAYSKSGAVGLMQIMPRDGIASKFQCINGPCFASRPTIEELLDPQNNVDYGTKMIASLIKRFGNERDALKAYGPMDVGYYYADIVLNIYDKYK